MSRSLGRGSWPRRAWLAASVGPRRPTSNQLSTGPVRIACLARAHVHVTRNTSVERLTFLFSSLPEGGHEEKVEIEKKRKGREGGGREEGKEEKEARVMTTGRVGGVESRI